MGVDGVDGPVVGSQPEGGVPVLGHGAEVPYFGSACGQGPTGWAEGTLTVTGSARVAEARGRTVVTPGGGVQIGRAHV